MWKPFLLITLLIYSNVIIIIASDNSDSATEVHSNDKIDVKVNQTINDPVTPELPTTDENLSLPSILSTLSAATSPPPPPPESIESNEKPPINIIKPLPKPPSTQMILSAGLPLLSTLLNPPSSAPPKTSTIMYDQRQDGKYNIRADLENFMIVVIPASSTASSSLLDLLTRSNSRKTGHSKKRRNYNKRKSSHKKYDKTKNKEEKIKYENNDDYEQQKYEQLAIPSDPHIQHQQHYNVKNQQQLLSQNRFIEGRTPYHVDITSSEVYNPIGHDGRSHVDQMMTPPARKLYNIQKSNSPVFRLLRPSSIDIIEDDHLPQQPIHFIQQQQPHAISVYPRIARSLFDSNGNGINTNKVQLSDIDEEEADDDDEDDNDVNSEDNSNFNEYFQNHSTNRKFQNDLLTSTINGDSKSLHSYDGITFGNIERLALANPKSDTNDGWQLTLLGATENCGPDRRRDSYGVCQFIPNDYK